MEKKELFKLLEAGLSHGADFCELFLEDASSWNLQARNGELQAVDLSNTYGVGVRLLQQTDEIYGFTNDLDFNSLLTFITDLGTGFSGGESTPEPLQDAQPTHHIAKIYGDKIELTPVSRRLIRWSKQMKEADPAIVQAVCTLHHYVQKVLIVNSKGLYQDDLRIRTRLSYSATAKNEVTLQSVHESYGKSRGIEILDERNFDHAVLEIARRAVEMLSAQEVKSQEMTVVLNNGFGGVIFHEACGHPLEATAIAKNQSPFVNQIGQKIGSDLVTAYDDASIEGEWGYVNYDDEGHPGQRKLLIENGILQDYMVDYRNGITMQHQPNGASRRQSYKYSPTSRMSSTFIDNGESTPEEIIAATEYGLYAASLGGGSVNPATGEFNFTVDEGYMIENGQLTKRVRGAVLVGKGEEILHEIDMVGNNRTFGQGMCGSISGNVPTDVGQPTLRVRKMRVGGRG
jgi:TldD protein